MLHLLLSLPFLKFLPLGKAENCSQLSLLNLRCFLSHPTISAHYLECLFLFVFSFYYFHFRKLLAKSKTKQTNKKKLWVKGSINQCVCKPCIPTASCCLFIHLRNNQLPYTSCTTAIKLADFCVNPSRAFLVCLQWSGYSCLPDHG